MGINDFRVLQPLGQGSFASVFKVVRKSDDGVYAMKRVNISKMSKKEVSDTLNEIRFLASLRHHNIVAYFESFLDKNDTELCIVMEYCGMGDLAAKIERYRKRRRYIDERQIWQYITQTCDALKLLHEQGIMHRDVKAANCFLGEDGSVKLGDMNVSKRMTHGLLKTQIGTPYYMSPEIWSNRPYNAASDMWALGCMVYELCALRPPFLADSFPELKRQVQSGQYPPISRNYSYALSTVVAKLLRTTPRERPTARELLESREVRDAISGHGHDPAAATQQPMELLETIKVPHNITRLTNQLPKACYPDKRPNSPEKWPITHRRASQVAAEAEGVNGGGGGRSGSAESKGSQRSQRSHSQRSQHGGGGGSGGGGGGGGGGRGGGGGGGGRGGDRLPGVGRNRLSAVQEASDMPIAPRGSNAQAVRQGRQASSDRNKNPSTYQNSRQSQYAPKNYGKGGQPIPPAAAYQARYHPTGRSQASQQAPPTTGAAVPRAPGGYHGAAPTRGGYSQQGGGGGGQKWW